MAERENHASVDNLFFFLNSPQRFLDGFLIGLFPFVGLWIGMILLYSSTTVPVIIGTLLFVSSLIFLFPFSGFAIFYYINENADFSRSISKGIELGSSKLSSTIVFSVMVALVVTIPVFLLYFFGNLAANHFYFKLTAVLRFFQLVYIIFAIPFFIIAWISKYYELTKTKF